MGFLSLNLYLGRACSSSSWICMLRLVGVSVMSVTNSLLLFIRNWFSKTAFLILSCNEFDTKK